MATRKPRKKYFVFVPAKVDQRHEAFMMAMDSIHAYQSGAFIIPAVDVAKKDAANLVKGIRRGKVVVSGPKNDPDDVCVWVDRTKLVELHR